MGLRLPYIVNPSPFTIVIPSEARDLSISDYKKIPHPLRGIRDDNQRRLIGIRDDWLTVHF